MHPCETAHHILPFAHRSVLALANIGQVLTIVLAVFEVFNVLLDALLRHLSLKLACGALRIDMRKLVLVYTRGCLLEETPLTTTVNGSLPLGQALGVSQCESGSVVLKARPGEFEYSSETEAKKVVTPFIYTC